MTIEPRGGIASPTHERKTPTPAAISRTGARGTLVPLSGLSAALCLAFGASSAWGQDPEFRYLHGGSVYGLAMLDEDQGATGEDGGRIRYTTDGTTWTVAVVPDEVRGQLRGVFFLDQNNAWCVGDGGVVLKSTDRGAVWIQVNSASPITNIRTDEFGVLLSPPELAELYDIWMFDALTGYAVGNAGVLVYTDDGWATWTQMTGLPDAAFDPSTDPANFYDMHFFDDETGIFVANYGKVLRMTTDGQGQRQWSAPTFTDGFCTGGSGGHDLAFWSVAFTGSKGWLAGGFGTNSGVLAYSEDSGETWTPVQQAAAISSSIEAEWISNCATTTLYAVTSGGASPRDRGGVRIDRHGVSGGRLEHCR